MRVLWICNIPNNEASEKLKLKKVNLGGWLTGLSMNLITHKEIELYYTFPLNNIEEIMTDYTGSIKYIAFPRKIHDPVKYEKNIENQLKIIKNDIRPDIVHIFGTEYPTALSATKVFHDEALVISIQGMTSVIQNYFLADLPYNITRKTTIYELLRSGNIQNQKKRLNKRGKYEVESLKSVKYVIGRTEWDKACTLQINPGLRYFYCNETLRSTFYEDKWNIDKIERLSIFISQASSPIKGFHYLLNAVNILKMKYPNVRIYVSGNNLLNNKRLKGLINISSYAKYIKRLITKYKLEKNIVFLGALDEFQMKKQYLKSHVFVCPSAIENSPNSLGEAMMLGVPSVASYVGGIPSMLEHNNEGFLYQYNAPYMLAYYIDKIFCDDKIAINISKNATIKAEKTHDKRINSEKLIEIYNFILNENRDLKKL